MSESDTIFEQVTALPLEERQRLIQRLARASDMSAGPEFIGLDAGSPRVFTAVGALGSLAGLGVLTFGVLLLIFPCSHGWVPSGSMATGAGLVMTLFMGLLTFMGLQLWNEQDQLAEADL